MKIRRIEPVRDEAAAQRVADALAVQPAVRASALNRSIACCEKSAVG